VKHFASKLLLSERAHLQLQTISIEQDQAILITGPEHIGKTSLVNELIAFFLPKHIDGYSLLQLNGELSGIAEVKEAIRSLSVKLTSDNSIHRIVLLQNADLLSIEAQNALLKSIEEPPARTIFILSANGTETILGTIQSRTRQVQLTTPSYSKSKDYFYARNNINTTTDFARLYQKTGGLPGAIQNELSGSSDDTMNAAKTYITATLLDKLIIIEKISKSRQDCLLFVTNLLVILQALQRSSSLEKVKKYASNVEHCLTTLQAIQDNGNIKLQLASLSYRLK
jgi:DNA polymerase III delta prime subunit